MDWKEYGKEAHWHSDAKLFPRMTDEELASLAEDIAKNGLQEPVKLFEGKVLDGRNRVLACLKIGVKPEFVQWHRNGISPLAFVVAQNLERRHLTPSQRAALGALVLPELNKEALGRQRAAGQHGVRGGRGHKRGKPSAQKSANGLGKSSEVAAARFGVSPRTIEKAAALAKKQPGILRKIAAGKVTLQQADKETNCRGKLHERFVAPPFTVLDSKQGYWRKRKDYWHAAGARGGHKHQRNSSLPKSDGYEDTSAFDPVLAECVYRWFAPRGGRVLDPFAGESIKGIVAAKLGYDYTGIEVRKEQVQENRKQARKLGLSPQWVWGNGADKSSYPTNKAHFDLIFTSPPYYDLEKYSTDSNDGSAAPTYEQFLALYGNVFKQAVARLKQNRFVVVKIGDVRDKQGFDRNLPGDSVSCFLRLGLKIYNMAILATPLGTLPIRSAAPFEQYRKLGRAHQYVQCFFKGDNPKVIPQELGVLAGTFM